jgi:ribose transport system substrate-binding protein
MSTSQTYPVRPSASKVPLLIAVVMVIVAAIAVYFAMMPNQSERHVKLALLTWTQDPFWEPLIRGAQESADQSNAELVIVRSEPTVEAQNKHLQDLLASGIDGIAISPNSATEQLPVLNDAAAKAKVVTFDSDVPDSKRARFVGIDNYAAGHSAADELREALPEGGPVLISVGSVTMQHGRDRRQGVLDGLLERGFDRSRTPDPADAPAVGSKYSVVATVTDGGDPATAVKNIAEALKAHPEVKGIVGLFSYSAPSALQAMQQVGRAGQIKVVGFDDSDETQAAIAAGTIYSSILQDSHRAGYEVIRVLADEIRGTERGPAEVGPTLTVGINVLTADKLEDMRQTKTIRQPKSAPPAPTAPVAPEAAQ